MDRALLKSVRLLDRLRERLRYAHYSLRTEKTYVYWARLFIRFHKMRHPKDMGSTEVEAFLSFLANEGRVGSFHPSFPRGGESWAWFWSTIALPICERRGLT